MNSSQELYKEKYFKYKQKYLELKNQIAGNKCPLIHFNKNAVELLQSGCNKEEINKNITRKDIDDWNNKHTRQHEKIRVYHLLNKGFTVQEIEKLGYKHDFIKSEILYLINAGKSYKELIYIGFTKEEINESLKTILNWTEDNIKKYFESNDDK